MVDRPGHHDVCWGAIVAGTVVSCATTLIVLAFGVGGGLTAVSPWRGEGMSAPAFSIAAGVFLVAAAIIASALGGYITGRLRHSWDDVHEHERFFRDTAHGFVTWALATLVSATLLSAATTHIVAASSAGSIPALGAGAAQNASNNVGDRYADILLRVDNPAAQSNQQSDGNATRNELIRLIGPATRKGGDVSPADRTYAARIVAARTGLSQADAEQRVNQTLTQAKATADAARKSALKAALWLAAALLAGAFAAMLGAIEGGKLRNARWYETSTTGL
ncbi:MAG: hypothetical protein JO205_13550 [Pseudolabrys sp.]|nr:hypothetical protein [Pseudolabrys sp.]